MRRLPPLGALEAFVAVAQRQSLKSAAEDLSLSASALSRRVQALEAHVGRRMFDRLNGEFRLTPEGRDLLDRLAPAFDGLSRALEDTRAEGGTTVRLGVMPAFASAWLLPRIGDFKSRHPQVELILDTASAPMTRLSSNLDAAIVVANGPEEGLYGRQLCTQLVLAVCSPALLSGEPPLRHPADIDRHTVLIHRRMPELLDVWLDGLGLNDVRPHKIERYDSGPMLLEAAAHGLGVAIAFNTMVPTLLTSGRLVRPFSESVDSPLNYWFFCRHAALSSRGVKRLHDWIFEDVLPRGG